MQVNVHEAKSQLSRLLELVEEGETVVIARDGHPVAELIPARRMSSFPFGIAREQPLVPAGDDWWKALSYSRLKIGSRDGEGPHRHSHTGLGAIRNGISRGRLAPRAESLFTASVVNLWELVLKLASPMP